MTDETQAEWWDERVRTSQDFEPLQRPNLYI